MDFVGKRCLITGGSSGIGRALGVLLAERGADVWLLARDEGRLRTAQGAVRSAARDEAQRFGILQADVSQAGEVERALSPWQTEGAAPDLLINSAGVARPGHAHELPLDVFHWMMDVNYFGTVHVTQALLPAMLERGRGHIVNIASIAGFLGVFGYTAYGASKFAVRGYSDALRAELKGSGVGLTIAYPPDTETPQLEYENQFKPPETKILAGSADTLAPEQVARAILAGVERKRYLVLPGLEAKVLYWLSGALGPLLYPLMDVMVWRARRQLDRSALER